MNSDDFRRVHCYLSGAGGSLTEISGDLDDDVRRFLDRLCQRWHGDKAKIQKQTLTTTFVTVKLQANNLALLIFSIR